MSDSKAAALAQEYLDIQQTMDLLDTRASEVREELKGLLKFAEVHEPKTWELGKARVVWVKGRTTEKLDKAKLVQAGVTAAQLSAATTRAVGQPSMRIVPADDPSTETEA